MNEPCHRHFSNSIYLSWGRESTKWLKNWRQVFCNQSKLKWRDTGIVAPLILFSCCSGAQPKLSCGGKSRCSVWVFEAVNKLDLQSARWDNICSAVSPEQAPMHMCVCVCSLPPGWPADSSNENCRYGSFFWKVLKNCCNCNIYRITSLLRIFLRVFLRNWNRPLQLFWPEFTFFTDGWTSNEMGTCQCVEMSEW